MRDGPRITKRIYVASAALGLMLGTAGIAAATSHTTAQPVSATVEADVQEPSYESSITFTETEGQTEADEQAALEGMAAISADDAEAAAASITGTVTEVELDNENGAVVYSVDKLQDDGTSIDVKVDAGTGEVLAQDLGDDDESEAGEADDNNIQHENEFDGAEGDDPDEGHED